MADTAATFMFNRPAAIRAGPAIVGVCKVVFFMVGHVHLDRLGDSVSTGGDAVVPKTGGFVAGDADQLLDCLASLYARSPGE